MASKPRPLLQAPDLTEPTSSDSGAIPPRTDPNDTRFSGAEQFESQEALLRGVQKGSVRALNPETMPRYLTPVQRPPPKPRAPEVSLSTKVPESVMRELRRRYADTGLTIRVQVLMALREQGFEIEEHELQDDRKHPRR
jgi:hypothetical protein